MGVDHLVDFPVIELRRYDIKPGEAANFAACFDSYFPEAFQQCGSLVFGQFLERGDDTKFTWIRGFHDMDARASVNTAFYGGPLWREHSETMNERLVDHADVLLLRPVGPERGVTVLPAVDPVREPAGARGVVVAHVFSAVADRADECVAAVDAVAGSGYRDAGLHEAGLLVTLDAPNNFPALPFRTDGPYVVWLGVGDRDGAVADRVRAAAGAVAAELGATDLLQAAPELVILDPTPRSRLRWLES